LCSVPGTPKCTRGVIYQIDIPATGWIVNGRNKKKKKILRACATHLCNCFGGKRGEKFVGNKPETTKRKRIEREVQMGTT
jgi:hypothetical protein